MQITSLENSLSYNTGTSQFTTMLFYFCSYLLLVVTVSVEARFYDNLHKDVGKLLRFVYEYRSSSRADDTQIR